MRVAHGLALINRLARSSPRLSLFPRWYGSLSSPKPERGALTEGKVALADGQLPMRLSDPHPAADTIQQPKRGRKPRAKTEVTSDLGMHPRINPTSQNHHDLPTFLTYASATALSPTSMVYLGTHYEYLVSASLSRLGFTLTRVGGASDLGIDLLGHWSLPYLHLNLPAIIQCKASGPQAVMIRELEGAMQSAPSGWKSDGVIGLLAASKVATKGVRDAIARTSLPMGFLCVTADEGLVKQFIWNQAAIQRCGLEGVGVGLRLPEESVVLTWQGEPWEYLSQEERRAKRAA